SYFNAVIEVARFELLRPELQRPDGDHHVAREQDTRDDSQSDANREKQRSAVKNSVDRLQRGTAWLLEKHMPIEKLNSGRRSQDRTAVQVVSEAQGRPLVLCHRADLRQIPKSGTEAHVLVGVGEQAPLRPDNI